MQWLAVVAMEDQKKKIICLASVHKVSGSNQRDFTTGTVTRWEAANRTLNYYCWMGAGNSALKLPCLNWVGLPGHFTKECTLLPAVGVGKHVLVKSPQHSLHPLDVHMMAHKLLLKRITIVCIKLIG